MWLSSSRLAMQKREYAAIAELVVAAALQRPGESRYAIGVSTINYHEHLDWNGTVAFYHTHIDVMDRKLCREEVFPP